MNATLKVRHLALAFAAAAPFVATSALAGDFGGGHESYKDIGRPAGVPVPAPVPVPDFKPTWYFRFDLGLGVVSDPSVGDDDFVYDIDDTGPIGLRTTPSSWFDADFNTFLTGGAGVGFHYGNNWRTDATVEMRSKDDVSINGTDTDPVSGNTFTIAESSKLEGTVWLANAYYDFASTRGFTPYVGAGVGLAWNEISRRRTEVGTIMPSAEDTDKAEKVTFAGAIMAGVSYDWSDITTVDLGYRYLYLQGTDATLQVANTLSRLEIGDQHAHQFRAGLRFNID
jgi:opacity protein-like surface antigen